MSALPITQRPRPARTVRTLHTLWHILDAAFGAPTAQSIRAPERLSYRMTVRARRLMRAARVASW
jgi:hypothetical protein